MFEREYREMSFVPRWSILRKIRDQNIAEHSYYVTLYAGQIADFINWNGDRAALLDAALRHDIEEVYMADWPGPSKRAVVNPEKYMMHVHNENQVRFGDDYEKRGVVADNIVEDVNTILKVADLMDECFYLATEKQLGNKAVKDISQFCEIRLSKAIRALPERIADDKTKGRLYERLIGAIEHHTTGQSVTPSG